MMFSTSNRFVYEVYGPPADWIDAAPSFRNKLLFKNVPIDMSAEFLLNLCKRFGIVYQFRLIIDCWKQRPSTAYIRYTVELDALAAMEMLNRYYLPNGETFNVFKIPDRRSLYVAPIPKDVPPSVLHEEFLRLFPKMSKLVPCYGNCSERRSYAFVEFNCHKDALAAKKHSLPGGLRLWGRNMIVVWAQTHKKKGNFDSKNTLIVRGMGYKTNEQEFYKRIRNLDVTTTALSNDEVIISLNNRTAASWIHLELKRMISLGYSIQWAEGSTHTVITKHVTDFCAELRMICLANGWQIPIILFGNNFRKSNIQYGSILLSDGNGNFAAFLMEIVTLNIFDIQETMCELVIGFLNKMCALRSLTLVYKVTNRSGHLVGRLNNLIKMQELERGRIRDWESICKMGLTLLRITMLTDEQVLQMYLQSFLLSSSGCSGSMEDALPNCVSVYPKYRNKPALDFNLNDTEIILVQRNNTFDKQLPPAKYITVLDENTIQLTYKRMPEKYILTYVDGGRYDFYHPTQQINVPPIWVSGHTYHRSVKNFPYIPRNGMTSFHRIT